jgi:hypothetical protein
VAIEKTTERVETPESQAQGSTVSVVVKKGESREYLGVFEDADIPAPDDPARNLYNAHIGIKNVLRDWREREHLIDINPMLTPAGKTDAKQKALPEFEAKLAPYEKVVAIHEDTVKELELQVGGVYKPGKESPTDAVRAGEIRSWFLKLPKGGRGGQVEVLHEALEENDRETLSAILTAPTAMKIIGPEMRAALIAACGEKEYPAETKKLEVARRRVAVAKFGLERVRELLRGNTPKPIRERAIIRTGR